MSTKYRISDHASEWPESTTAIADPMSQRFNANAPAARITPEQAASATRYVQKHATAPDLMLAMLGLESETA